MSVTSTITGLLGTGVGAKLAEKAYDRLSEIGKEGRDALAGRIYDPVTGRYSGGLADLIEEKLTFQPYTVTTPTGSNFTMRRTPDTVDSDGNVVPGQMEYVSALSDEEKTLQDALIARAGGFFDLAGQPLGNTTVTLEDGSTVVVPGREQEVFDRMMSAMAPERERARLDLEQRLANQGRLGVRTGMFGGTPEGLELAMAEEEARNKAILSAMEFAGNEQERQARLGTGMLASGYVPQAQLLSALEPGMTGAERRRQAISEATGAYGDTYVSGIESLLQSGINQAKIAGNLGSSLASTSLSGLFKGLFE
tara:strand:+ start:3333 stop:4259 length:927 start_codon:yes stop_codon:yes gene_type:complete